MRTGQKIGMLAALSISVILSISWAQQPQQAKPAQPPQYQQQPAPITLEKITDNIYQVNGGTGPIAASSSGKKKPWSSTPR